MLKKFTLVFALITSGSLIYDANFNFAHSDKDGAPAGRTGNPGELGGATCTLAGCHVGGPAATTEEATLTSDIPGTGYVAGTTYNMTVTVTKAGGTKFGFQVSPQTNTGALVGTLSNPGSGCKLIGGNKYVTHTEPGNSGSGGKTWTFQWTAPTAGTGDVTFWGAFNFANGNNSQTGDVIVNNSFTFSEATSAISELNSTTPGFSVYPNPVSTQLNVAFSLTETSEISTSLFSIDGKLVSKLPKQQLLVGEHKLAIDASSLTAGAYFVKVSDGKNEFYQKVIVK